MSEPLTIELVNDLLTELRVAFPQKRTPQEFARQARVYRDSLAGISGEALRHAVRRCIQDENFFPKVAKLREYAVGYEAAFRSRESVDRSPVDEQICPQCGRQYWPQQRWRPSVAVGDNGGRDFRSWLTTADGNHLLLEDYQRVVCQCSASCAFTPDPGLEPPMMLVRHVTVLMPLKRTQTVSTPRAA